MRLRPPQFPLPEPGERAKPGGRRPAEAPPHSKAAREKPQAVAVAPAFVAVDAQEPVRGDAAIQKGAEVAHNEKRGWVAAQLPAGEEGLKVLRDRMVQRAFPCAARPVRAHAHVDSTALGTTPHNRSAAERFPFLRGETTCFLLPLLVCKALTPSPGTSKSVSQ